MVAAMHGSHGHLLRLKRRYMVAVALLGASGLGALIATQPLVDRLGWSRAALLGVCLFTAAMTTWVPASAGRVARLCLWATLAHFTLAIWGGPPDRLLGVLSFMPAYTLFATIFIDPAFGLRYAALSSLVLASAFWAQPWVRQALPLDHLTNLMLALALQQAVLHSLWRGVAAGLERLDRLQAQLKAHLDDVTRLSQGAFQQARGQVVELRLALARGARDEAAALAQSLHELLNDQRHQLLLATPLDDADPRLDADALQASRRRLVGLALNLAFLAGGVTWLRSALLGIQLGWAMEALCFSLALAAALHAFASGWDRWLFRGVTLVVLGLIMVLSLQVLPQPAGMPSNAPWLLLVPVMAALIDGPALALLTGVGALVWVAFLNGRTELPLVVVLVLLSALLAGGLLAWHFIQALQAALAADGQALAQAAQARRRLLNMFFHDLADPLRAATSQLAAGQGDLQRASRLARRMEELLVVSSRAELGPAQQRPVPVKALVEALRDVYQDPLNAKRLRLWTDIPDGVLVLAVEEPLRQTVLGRLLSQAIQASPPGGDIELNLAMDGAWVELMLSDQGPGVPLAVRQSLRRPQGSAGWAGLGNSLALVRDTLAQMGGELRLDEARGGGTLVVVRLRSCVV